MIAISLVLTTLLAVPLLAAILYFYWEEEFHRKYGYLREQRTARERRQFLTFALVCVFVGGFCLVWSFYQTGRGIESSPAPIVTQ
jgi:hypothetical protein